MKRLEIKGNQPREPVAAWPREIREDDFEVFGRTSALKAPRVKPMVSIYVAGGSQIRVNRAGLVALGIEAPCSVRLLFDRSKKLGAIEKDPSGEEWKLSITKGVGFIGCKLFIERALELKKKRRCRAWMQGARLVFDHGRD